MNRGGSLFWISALCVGGFENREFRYPQRILRRAFRANRCIEGRHVEASRRARSFLEETERPQKKRKEVPASVDMDEWVPRNVFSNLPNADTDRCVRVAIFLGFCVRLRISEIKNSRRPATSPD